MEEYFFKGSQAMNFGNRKPILENIYQAVLMKGSMNYTIFQHNLEKMIDEIVVDTGVRPIDRVNENAEEEMERQEKDIALEKAKSNNIPKYHFHTETSVHKVINCPNKSHLKRVKRHGLMEAIAEDNNFSREKMKDMKKIAQYIDKVISIETQREKSTDPAETLNPYL